MARRFRLREIYGTGWVIVVKRDTDCLAVGAIGVVRGKLFVIGWEPVLLHVHNNSIIGNNHIMVIVWLNHLYVSQ